MKIRYYAETDTLYIEFRDVPVLETRDPDENTLLDLDARDNICAITVEHASERAGIPQFSYKQVAPLGKGVSVAVPSQSSTRR